MKKQTIKKALPMVLGALIVSTVVLVIPFNNFAEANREYFVSKNIIIERKLEANKAETNKVENTKYITLEEAQNIALKRVGDKTAKITEVKIDLNDKKPYYEIEITTNHTNGKMEMIKKFEIEINAITGKIVDVDVEVKKFLNGKVIVDKDNNDKDKDKIIPMEKIYITREKAIEITENKIGNNVTLEEIELDHDDKVPVYEIEMYDEEYEYEIEIHAITGEILKFEKERD